MDFPEFFDRAPAVTLRDPLAAFLGVIPTGLLQYRYGDAVRLAGHSCPTVAGAWLMLCHGLRRLYGPEPPERGGIAVHLQGAADEGVTGVIGSVAQLVTGAAPESGFGGIGAAARFARRGLLRYGAAIPALMGLRRLDSGAGVLLDLDAAAVPAAPELPPLFARALNGVASAGEAQRFGRLWQERVERMLTGPAGDAALVRRRDWPQSGHAGAGAMAPAARG